MTAHDQAYAALRHVVITAHRNGAGVRAIHEATGIATRTIVRWNAENDS